MDEMTFSKLTVFQDNAKNFTNSANSSRNGSEQLDSDFSKPDPSQELFNNILGRLSFLGCVLSTVALMTLIITYVCISELRNLAGLLTIMLASTLFTALLCFLLKPQLYINSHACYIIAVLTVFSYLSSFTWMSMLAIDLLRSFSDATGSYRGRNRGRRFIKYSLVGWAIPLLITVSAVLCDRLLPNHTISPGFGRDALCFISGLKGLIVFFFAPISVSVGVNFVISVLLFRTVYVSAASTHNVNSSDTQKQVFFMCLKLTFVFGLTWGFSLAAAGTTNDHFRAVCGFINSLQGVFIAIAFLTSQRIVRTIRSTAASTYASIASEGRQRPANHVLITNSSVDYLNMRRIQ